MATTVSEAELLARARAGDEDAFTELYQQHLAPVRAVARAILRRNDVEDICQDIFLLGFTRLQGFAGKSSFRSWITRIALNLQRLSRRQRQMLTMAYLENVPDLEIAEILGTSLSAVRSSIHLAKRRVRERYKK